MTLTRSFFYHLGWDSWRFPLDSQLRGYLWTRNCGVFFGLAIAWFLWARNCVVSCGLAMLVLYSWLYILGFIFLALYSWLSDFTFQITGFIFQALYSRIGNALAASALLRGLALGLWLMIFRFRLHVLDVRF